MALPKLCPGREQAGATAHDRDARGGQRIALPDRLSVAAVAQGVSAVLDGSAVFLPVAGSGVVTNAGRGARSGSN